MFRGTSVTRTATIYRSAPDQTNARVATVSVAGDALTITGVTAGVAVVTVTAEDPRGLTATQSVVVTVNPVG